MVAWCMMPSLRLRKRNVGDNCSHFYATQPKVKDERSRPALERSAG
jgi:hypothetical protein